MLISPHAAAPTSPRARCSCPRAAPAPRSGGPSASPTARRTARTSASSPPRVIRMPFSPMSSTRTPCGRPRTSSGTRPLEAVAPLDRSPSPSPRRPGLIVTSLCSVVVTMSPGSTTFGTPPVASRTTSLPSIVARASTTSAAAASRAASPSASANRANAVLLSAGLDDRRRRVEARRQVRAASRRSARRSRRCRSTLTRTGTAPPLLHRRGRRAEADGEVRPRRADRQAVGVAGAALAAGVADAHLVLAVGRRVEDQPRVLAEAAGRRRRCGRRA